MFSVAVRTYWRTRAALKKKQQKKGARPDDSRGGKQMDGFASALYSTLRKAGIPPEWLLVRGCVLPGFYRPLKRWDFVVRTPSEELVAVIEFKSQMGSFSRNFNNRIEEATGNAAEFKDACANGFYIKRDRTPWLGYLLLVHACDESRRTVRLNNQAKAVSLREEFKGDMSFLDRYTQAGEVLLKEGVYSGICILACDRKHRNSPNNYQELMPESAFVDSLVTHCQKYLPSAGHVSNGK